MKKIDNRTPSNHFSSKKYLYFLFLYMMFYEFMDSYTTSYYTAVVSYIQADLGVDDSGFYLIQAIATLGLFLVLVIQNLADNIGRKPMMIIVFFGMGFSALIMFLAYGNAIIFTIGFLLSWMFFSSDMWVIIISEEAPEEKRGRYSYIIAVVGALGAIAIPISRQIFINVPATEDPTVWRPMNFLPMLAMPLAFLGIFMKETTAYKNKREITSGTANKLQAKRKTNIWSPFKTDIRSSTFIFMILGALLGATAAATSTFENFLTNYIDNQDIVTYIIYVATFGTFFFFGITGYLADKFGRKSIFLIYTIIIVIFYLLFAFMGPFAADIDAYWLFYIGAFFANGAFWGLFMLSKTYCVECFPTDIRGTATGWRSFLYAAGLTLGSLFSSYLATQIELRWIYVIFVLMLAFVSIPLVSMYLPETKGINIIDL